MKISVLGAGLVGITTAYMLKKGGHDVTIIDKHEGPAMECSFSNGAQLSFCHAEPWASYSYLLKGLKWLGKKDAPLLIKPSFDPDLWKWMIKFILNCSNAANLSSTERILKLGLYSREILHEMEPEFDFDFSHRKGGKIFVLSTKKEFESYLKQARIQELFGSQYQVLTHQQTLEIEPGLKDMMPNIYGVVRNPLDESADAYEYCVAMEKKLKKMGVCLKYNTKVTGFDVEKNKVKSLNTEEGEIETDMLILCTGSESPRILKSIGVNLPLYPIKGYSITFDLEEGEEGVRESITDHHNKIVYTGLGKRMRAAGTAEFTGHNTDITKTRIDLLKSATKKSFPTLNNVDASDEWACLRPFMPDGVPVVGKTDKYENLILNTGHGTLGWTQTFATARMACDIIEERETRLNPDWYSINRF